MVERSQNNDNDGYSTDMLKQNAKSSQLGFQFNEEEQEEPHQEDEELLGTNLEPDTGDNYLKMAVDF